MSPRASVFREPRGYLPGPLPANKWSRRPTMMNCEFGSSPVCLQPASVPASIESVMLNQLKVTVSYRHPRRRGVPRGVHRRRGGGYHRVGGGESETPHSGVLRAGVGGGRGGRDPSPRSRYKIYKIPLMGRICYGARCAVFCGQNPPKPAKKALHVSRGVQKPAISSLGVVWMTRFCSPPHSHGICRIDSETQKSPHPRNCSSTWRGAVIASRRRLGPTANAA